jgi:putative heme-binding domain-containing protein
VAVPRSGPGRERDALAVKLLQNGNTSTGEARIEAATRLLSTTSGALMLLHAVEDESIHAPLRNQVVDLGNAHADGQVRDLFERFLPEEKRVQRLGTIVRPESILAIKGDAERGRKLFFDTAGILCKSCHLIKGQGREIGPDLSQVGKKYQRSQILENLLEPSKNIEEKYLTYVVETTSGKIHTGLLVERATDSVTLKDNEGKLIKTPAKEIEVLEAQRKSLMPDLLLRDMTAEQVADLMEYLSNLK